MFYKSGVLENFAMFTGKRPKGLVKYSDTYLMYIIKHMRTVKFKSY